MGNNARILDQVIHQYPNGKTRRVTMPGDDYNRHRVAAQLIDAGKKPGEKVYIQTERGED